MKKSSIIFMCIIALLLIAAGIVMATGGFMSSFNSTYGTTGTRLDSCNACHTSSIPALNNFGDDWATFGFGAVLDNEDSDGDGVDNIAEIIALSFPGDPDDTPVVANMQPTADPNGPYTAETNTPVDFDGSASSDADGTIDTYSWNFGDGSTGTGETTSHAYAAAGVYTVSLTVTDDGGLSDTAETEATISDAPTPNLPPVADPNGPYTGETGTAVDFDGSGSSDPDGTIESYAWDFGDGNTGTGVAPSHAYAAAGEYTVSLTVADEAGAVNTNTATTTATIIDPDPGPGPVNEPPVADPNGPYTGETETAVDFDGSGSSDSDGTIETYAWDFGDGNTGTGETPSHAYAVAGMYTVSLTVTDDAGANNTATTTATISDPAPGENLPPVADPNGPYTGTAGIAVMFDGSGSSDPEGGAISYAWEFGNGSTGSGVAPSHVYAKAGTYTVSLTVADDGGLSDTTTTTATITADEPPPPPGIEPPPGDDDDDDDDSDSDSDDDDDDDDNDGKKKKKKKHDRKKD